MLKRRCGEGSAELPRIYGSQSWFRYAIITAAEERTDAVKGRLIRTAPEGPNSLTGNTDVYLEHDQTAFIRVFESRRARVYAGFMR